jgi:hypothetical protein
VKFALEPEPAPVLLRVGIAVLLDMIVVFVTLKTLLLATGYPPAHVTHAVLPALFGGLFGFLGSLGGSTRSGLLRALLLSALALPLTLVAIGVRESPIGAGVTLAAAAAFAGFLAWYGEPLATLGSLLLYMTSSIGLWGGARRAGQVSSSHLWRDGPAHGRPARAGGTGR